jgi:hypothetical protein
MVLKSKQQPRSVCHKPHLLYLQKHAYKCSDRWQQQVAIVQGFAFPGSDQQVHKPKIVFRWLENFLFHPKTLCRWRGLKPSQCQGIAAPGSASQPAHDLLHLKTVFLLVCGLQVELKTRRMCNV